MLHSYFWNFSNENVRSPGFTKSLAHQSLLKDDVVYQLFHTHARTLKLRSSVEFIDLVQLLEYCLKELGQGLQR